MCGFWTSLNTRWETKWDASRGRFGYCSRWTGESIGIDGEILGRRRRFWVRRLVRNGRGFRGR